MRFALRALPCALAAASVLAPALASATEATKVFTNTRSIKINDFCADPDAPNCAKYPDLYNIRETVGTQPVAKSSPYGSSITVPDKAFPDGYKIKDVNVTLSGLSHALVDDVDVLLVAPNGQYVMLMSNVSGSTASGDTSTAVQNLTFTFDDSAPLPLPNSTRNDGRLSGSSSNELYNVIYDEWVNVWTDPTPRRYKPTDYDPTSALSVDDLDQFREPAPSGLITPGSAIDTSTAEIAAAKVVTSGPKLSSFNGTAPAGAWRLYVVDDFFWYDGEIKGGWSLEITAAK